MSHFRRVTDLWNRTSQRFFLFGIMILVGYSGIGRSVESATQSRLELDPHRSLQVESHFKVYEDPSSSLTIQDILRSEYQEKFKAATPDDFNKQFTKSHFWIKFTVRNQTDIKHWYLIAQQPLMKVKVYRSDKDHEVIEETSLERRLPVSKVLIVPGTETTFFLRVSSAHIIDLHFEVMSEEIITQKNQNELILISLAAGCFLAMIFYNFFLYISLRDRNHFYYLLFAIWNGFLGLQAVNFPMGITTWFGIDWCENAILARPLGPLTAFMFARSFLQIKKNSPRLDKIFISYMGGLLVFMALSFFLPVDALASSCDLYFLVGIIILIYAGFFYLNKGFKPALYYLLALGSFLLGILIYLATIEKLFPFNAVTSNAHLVGQAIEMLLMSLALAAKIKLLQIEKTRSEVISQTKSRLLRVLAHDIANPLTVVKYVADILRKKEIQTQYMEKILRSVDIIQEIVRFVLKSEAAGESQQLNLQPVVIRDVFEHLSFLFQNTAEEKGLTLKFELEHPDLAAKAEQTSLSNEVLGNLLSNAIKFSFSGSEINLHAFQKNKKIIITVKDHGIGMSPEILARLFSPCKAQSRPGTQNEAGTGYGLFLVKSFVNAYGGTIEVHSKSMSEDVGHSGTCYKISIPAAQATVASTPIAQNPRAMPRRLKNVEVGS